VMTLLFDSVDSGQLDELELTPVKFIANETDITKLLTSSEGIGPEQPETFALQQNYPNPFNPTTSIQFDLPVRADVKLEVYNMIGRQVAVLANRDSFGAGIHIVSFDASGFASGMYIYRIEVSNTESGEAGFVQTRKMMLIK